MSDEKKIVVDDDWKDQVAKEKEELENKAEADPAGGEPEMEMPEASFQMLVTTLTMQAGSALGQFPDPVTGKPQINKPVAKHFIDTLVVLEEKTKGNLDAQESEMLTSTIHQLRMAFIAMPDKLPEEAENAGDSENKSSIELP